MGESSEFAAGFGHPDADRAEIGTEPVSGGQKDSEGFVVFHTNSSTTHFAGCNPIFFRCRQELCTVVSSSRLIGTPGVMV